MWKALGFILFVLVWGALGLTHRDALRARGSVTIFGCRIEARLSISRPPPAPPAEKAALDTVFVVPSSWQPTTPAAFSGVSGAEPRP